MTIDLVADGIILPKFLYNIIYNNHFDDSGVFYGDMIIVETDFVESKIVKLFCPKINGKKYTHLILKTEKNYAEGLDLDGRVRYDLSEIPYE